jgi:FkbM family methyltransferase
MTFVSYAQNFEDVMLWRALKHVEQGFYIDVGAWSPDLDSVTRAFYERGWSGINIEPNPEFHQQLQQRRLRDRNLCLAVGDREGFLTMNFLSNSGLSTFDDAIAHEYERAGLGVNRQEVQVTTLTTVWRQYVAVGQNVHFLKVDVEGKEEEVLRGNDWTLNRPWVVVVEATLPNIQIESHQAWEPILLAANYYFAYADGLNRFYVANERAELLATFKYPPNVFDDFVLSQRLPQLEAEKAHLIAELQASEADRAARGEQIQALMAMLKESECDRAARLEQIHELTSLLKESECDRAVRWEQIQTLTAMLKESDGDRAALMTDLRTLFAHPTFRWMTRCLNWPEVKKLAERFKTSNE